MQIQRLTAREVPLSRSPLLTVGALALVAVATARTSSAQLTSAPLAPARERGQSVTPAYEGWYKNPDGTVSLSFGYYNRNLKETLDIPVGPNNFIQPGPADRGQPTFFAPRRHWGVFAVTVPADFTGKVVWTLIIRGDTIAIPGHLRPNWEIDALHGEAGSGNTPPTLAFSADGPKGAGPLGLTSGPLTTAVGAPLSLTVWASDDGRAESSIVGLGKEGVPVKLTWFKHQGPGNVVFGTETPAVDKAKGTATTTAIFSAPGSYLLRVRANDASGVISAGHAQCCWSNGFVKVTVTP